MTDRPLPPYLDRPHLDSIEERELDLLLLYELHACPEFRRFVLNKFTTVAETAFVGAWRGVCDLGGETDILLLCDMEEIGRTAIMIEDKIDAGFQDNQARRYRERGDAGRADGAWDKFWTCLCAPKLFLEPLRGAADWDMFLPLEEIVSWLEPRAGHDNRTTFFGAALTRASGKFERGGFVPDNRATGFWRAYRNLCSAEFPDLKMRPLNDVQSRNEPWPGFVMPAPSVGVHLEHKSWKGHVDVTFDREPIDAVRTRLGDQLSGLCEIVKTGGSTALRIAVTPLQHLEPFDQQQPAVREAFEAVRRLLAEWPKIRSLMGR